MQALCHLSEQLACVVARYPRREEQNPSPWHNRGRSNQAPIDYDQNDCCLGGIDSISEKHDVDCRLVAACLTAKDALCLRSRAQSCKEAHQMFIQRLLLHTSHAVVVLYLGTS